MKARIDDIALNDESAVDYMAKAWICFPYKSADWRGFCKLECPTNYKSTRAVFI